MNQPTRPHVLKRWGKEKDANEYKEKEQRMNCCKKEKIWFPPRTFTGGGGTLGRY